MDGDGWSRCALGHRHWGRYGAAGLLVVAPGPAVLLQHRAPWSHGGDTWGVPGGARRRTETAVEAALRETTEETALDVSRVRVTGRHVDDHGSWAYVTVLADHGGVLAAVTDSTPTRPQSSASKTSSPSHSNSCSTSTAN